MRHHFRQLVRMVLGLAVLTPFFAAVPAWAQGAARYSGAADSAASHDVKALTELVRQLQSQVESLNARVKMLEAREQQAESAGLQEDRGRTHSTLAVSEGRGASTEAASTPAPKQENDEKIARLEEDLELANSKIREQSQTKVESSSKYRVRLSGLALFNLFTDRGTVDNEDFPQIARPTGTLSSSGSFGGSLRQSQIGLEAFGPEIGGARTSADIRFDFAGGFPQAPNGNTLGVVRLRTGTVRLDWTATSIVAGQDFLFFSPLAPTSFASLAIPAFSYSGNLWGWAPQLRVEHRWHISEGSTILVQGGILQVLSGDSPVSEYTRRPSWGEQSGQPAYATRVAWSHPAFGQNIVAGIGGYYGRQFWGFDRHVDGWVGSADLTVPLGQFVEFTGQFYRGRAVGGLAGGIGQSVLWNGSLANPATEVYGLDSMGGWVQLKMKPRVKFEVNGAVGNDSPFSYELRKFGGNSVYPTGPLSKNLASFLNLIYRPRSNVIFSLEYKHLKTFTLDSTANAADHVNLSVGYIF